MKKIIKSIALVAVCSTGLSAFGQGNKAHEDNQLIGKAKHAVNDCLQPYRGSFYEIGSFVETTGICFVEGFLKRVSFSAGPNCHGTQPCPDFPTRIVAYVDFDCDGNIIGVTCL